LILLDTHVVVWLAGDSGQMSRKALRAIAEARATGTGLAICAITMLELAMLSRKNKIQVETGLVAFLDELESRFRVLPITAKACARAAELPASYPNDPVDRIIGATAIVEGLALVTADQAIRQSKALRTIW
jgi:PIN domain nuclease of toxin-antitoxin system